MMMKNKAIDKRNNPTFLDCIEKLIDIEEENLNDNKNSFERIKNLEEVNY